MAKEDKKQTTVGLSVKKDENSSEWYTQVIQKTELADYSVVSGCIVFRPYSYQIWDNIKNFFDAKIRKSGVDNAYFPMFIPESLLMKEQEHVAGFTPEVAWVTHAGDTKLSERLAIRPTSETIMYDSYSKWIRSYNDLPLRINQWNSVVRWEFKHAIPFLRTREFLWQEGHTVFATQKDAGDEVLEILDYYAEVFEDLLAIPVIKGKKTESEKFAGALYSTTVETYLPVKKAIQGATSHCLGQNFAKAFDIKFVDRDGETKLAWQNSWGLSTRTIGIMILMHGDDKGLVLPPRVAPITAVIIPILFDKTKDMLLKKANELKKMLSEDYTVKLDDRADYRPGWKFNEWELKGVPLRIELGPKDLENEQVMIARRDTGKKTAVKWKDLKKGVDRLLNEMHKNLYEKAKAHLKESIRDVKDWKEFMKAVHDKKWVKAHHCGNADCEASIKEKSGGLKTNCIPFEQPKKLGKCVLCGKPAKYEVLFAKSY
ncbi:TPA: proline--tRNA ligase [Candidatus Woesearchaeota archaeon]|nr:Bifunctional aminoacyl-tRNA synthetase [archaeon GW2011_AR15]MBS3104210.1 proline--tRNA ligase [Candidatus Woesearchaeota archaeon]HIH41960.1 proline--tRNA ligase [Candidatus Woesearchaeota archaeon]